MKQHRRVWKLQNATRRLARQVGILRSEQMTLAARFPGPRLSIMSCTQTSPYGGRKSNTCKEILRLQMSCEHCTELWSYSQIWADSAWLLRT